MRHLQGRVLLTLLAALVSSGFGCKEKRDIGGSSGRYELSPQQLEHGVGPISAFELGPVDSTLAAMGAALFEPRCSACHEFGTRGIGPDLAGILERRSPAYVMNMILNPEEMIERHPEARALLDEYRTPMADQNLSAEEARAILEWLRWADLP